jgi:hypothetical protein
VPPRTVRASNPPPTQIGELRPSLWKPWVPSPAFFPQSNEETAGVLFARMLGVWAESSQAEMVGGKRGALAKPARGEKTAKFRETEGDKQWLS